MPFKSAPQRLPRVTPVARYATLWALMLTTAVGCGSVSDSPSSALNTETASGGITVQGAAVKGPLVGADVRVYMLDPQQVELKGELVALGSTDQQARLVLTIPQSYAEQGPFLIEYTGGTELNGEIPVIGTLTTILTNQQFNSGTPVYATPLTSFTIAHASQTADKVEDDADLLTAGLSGDNNGTVSTEEFLAALETSTTHVKNALGLGVLSDEIDLFTTSPMLDNSAAADDSLAVRTANEVFAAIVETVQTEIEDDGFSSTGANVVASLAEDFSDGTFDSQQDGQAISTLAAVDNLNAAFTSDPSQLTVPGTGKKVHELAEILLKEASDRNQDIPDTNLGTPILKVPDVTVYVDGTSPTNPEPTPNPDPEPTPEPQLPIVSIQQSANDLTILEGQSVGISVSASDADGIIEHCRLSLNGSLIRQDSTVPYAWGTAAQNVDAMLQNMLTGNYQIMATCTDNSGLSRTDSIALTVTAVPDPIEPPAQKIAPTVAFSEPNANTVIAAGESLGVTVSANDSDGQIENCQLTLNQQLVRQENVAPFNWGSSGTTTDSLLENMAPGGYQLQATCIDDDNLSATSNLSFTVLPAAASPTVNIALATNTLNEGDALTVILNANDADGDLSYCDLFLDGNLVRRDSAAPFQFGAGTSFDDTALSSATVGSHTVVAECVDSGQRSAITAADFIIAAAPEPEPTIFAVTLDWGIPSTREDGTALSIGEIDHYEIHYYHENQGVNGGSTLTVAPTTATGTLNSSYGLQLQTLGTYYFSINVIDSEGKASDLLDAVSLTLSES